MRTREVRLFDAPFAMPDGPLRLAELSGAPILPIFTARTGYRQYDMKVFPAVRVAARGGGDERERGRDAAAQLVADAMTTFVRAHPAQWFRFHRS
jgi:KDO2-lipid IV(A) lauroyltransferase